MTDRSESLRAILRTRTPTVATFVMLPRIEIVEMLGLAGFDAVVLDLEHGPIGVGDLTGLAAASRAVGIHAIARLPEGRPATIAAALDAGVDGVMVPHVSSGEVARDAVRASRFPPDGQRSLNPYVRGTAYDGSTSEAIISVNDANAVICMVEGTDGLADLDSVLSTDGLDAVFIGPVDLSAALGHPGQPDHPQVLLEIESIFSRAADAGVACGVYAPSPDRASTWFDFGATLVAVSADAAMVLDAFRAIRGSVNTSKASAR